MLIARPATQSLTHLFFFFLTPLPSLSQLWLGVGGALHLRSPARRYTFIVRHLPLKVVASIALCGKARIYVLSLRVWRERKFNTFCLEIERARERPSIGVWSCPEGEWGADRVSYGQLPSLTSGSNQIFFGQLESVSSTISQDYEEPLSLNPVFKLENFDFSIKSRPLKFDISLHRTVGSFYRARFGN